MESLYLAAMVAVIVRAATQEEVGREAREQLELLQPRRRGALGTQVVE
jgi:hypothetical protein